MILPWTVSAALFIVLNNLREETEHELRMKERYARASSLVSQTQCDLMKTASDFIAVNFEEGHKKTPSQFLRENLESNGNLWVSNAEKNVAELRTLLDEDSEAKQLCEEFASTVKAGKMRLTSLMDESRDRQKIVRISLKERGFLMFDAETMSEAGSAIVRYCNHQLKRYSGDGSTSRKELFNTLSYALVLNLIFGILLTLFVTRRLINRLNIISYNSVKLARGQALESPLGGSDEVADLDGIFRRMSGALEAASRSEKALIANVSSVLISLDKDFRIQKVSEASTKVLGQSEGDLIGSHMSMLFAPDERAWVHEKVSDATRSDNEIVFEASVLKPSKDSVDVRWSVSWSPLEQTFFCVAVDISKEKQLARMKQQLMDTVAHDLRSPLTAVMNTLNLFQIGVLGELSEKAMAKINQTESSVARLVRLINDLLDFEKMESATVTLDCKTHSVDSLLSEAIIAVAPVAEAEQVNIDLELSELRVNADGDRILQVLVNLLSNAIKFSPTGGEIKVRSALTDSASLEAEDTISKNGSKSFIKIEIRDQGPGIPSELQRVIFDRYKMLDSQPAYNRTPGKEKQARQKGFGLGLAIARHIVDLHGGDIGVESCGVAGDGSTFWFTLEMVP